MMVNCVSVAEAHWVSVNCFSLGDEMLQVKKMKVGFLTAVLKLLRKLYSSSCQSLFSGHRPKPRVVLLQKSTSNLGGDHHTSM